jgi:flavin-dependent dehydrogenase
LVVDKAALPRSKPCGGGVSPAIKQWFDCDFAPAIETTVQRVYYTWKLGDPVQADLEQVQPMWMVQRDKFDHFLAQQARQQGATLQEQTEVLGLTRTSQGWQVKTAQTMLEAPYLIAADGVNSICAQWLGFAPRTSFSGASLEIPSLQGSLSSDRAYFDFGSLKNGYIWTFPKKNGYSISGGCFKGTLKGEELKKQLYHYAQQQGLDTAQAQYQEYPLNLWTENQPLHRDKAVLVGNTFAKLEGSI